MIIGIDPTIEGIYLVMSLVSSFAIGVYFFKEIIKWVKEIKKKDEEKND